MKLTSAEIQEYAKVPHTKDELLNHPAFLYYRRSNIGNQSLILVYFHCSDSPTKRLLAGSYV
jgi:hypothetical protein